MADEARIHEVTPPADVLDYFRAKQLAPAFSWLDVFAQEHAHAFTVAKAVDVDVLAAFRGTIDDAITRGLGYDDWVKGLEPKLESLGWWGRRTVADPDTGEVKPVDFSSPRRLQNIFWSNMRAARAAAQWDRAQRSKHVLPFFLYVETTAEDPRQEHLEWVGIILPIDHPFWTTHFPPNGWGCQCAVRQIGRVEAKRLGGVSADPVVLTRRFRNHRTGEEIEVPRGIDPGWHTNPGKSRTVGLGRVLADKIDRMPYPDLRQAAIGAIVQSEQFDRVLAGRAPARVVLPVAEAPVQAGRSVVLLSSETAIKQAARHPEATAFHYQSLSTFLSAADVIIDRNGILHYVGQLAGELWHAVIKLTAARDARYLTSLHRISPREIPRLRRQAARNLAEKSAEKE